MSDAIERTGAREHREALQRERDQPAEHIRKSRETITHSQELLKRMDEILADAPKQNLES
jgi:hypothetical protein